MRVERKVLVRGGVSAAALGVVAGGYLAWTLVAPASSSADTGAAPTPTEAAAVGSGSPSFELSEKQLQLIKVAPVGNHLFPVEKDAIGSIDFDENLSVQVFTPYQGKIIEAFAEIGDEVEKGKPLYTIDSPDLVQAESNLIGAAATYDLTSRALIRAQALYEKQGNGGIAEKDLEQAISDKLTAEGALKAARDAVRVFGKTETEIDRLIAQRKIDPALVVPSPITGRITARNAQPGLLVQPGNPPAPYSIADISTMWMLANVTESDSALYHVGQEVKVSVMPYPGRFFEGKISKIGATVDPNLHTLLVRSEIRDPKHELRPGMLADFVIETGDPQDSIAAPLNGIVREGDGTMTAWVTADRKKFTQRVVKIGLQNDGYDQILDGLKQGELMVIDGAVFLDNMLTASPTD